MASIFTRIISGEIPCYKIAESENYFAFLDIRPLTKGHTLVIPKAEVDYIFDIEEKLLGGLHVFSGRVARAIEQVVPCKRIAVVVLGLEVSHAHIHLIPIQSEKDIRFSNPRVELTNNEFEDLASKIRAALG